MGGQGNTLGVSEVEGCAVVLMRDGRPLPGHVTADILSAAIALGQLTALPAIGDGKAQARRQEERAAAVMAAERRLFAALRPAVPGL